MRTIRTSEGIEFTGVEHLTLGETQLNLEIAKELFKECELEFSNKPNTKTATRLSNARQDVKIKQLQHNDNRWYKNEISGENRRRDIESMNELYQIAKDGGLI